MKFLVPLIATVALAGCDVTFGADGPVVTTSDSIVGQMIPIGNRADASAPQSATTANQPAPANDQTTTDRPRRSLSLSSINFGAVRPIGVSSADVENFKTAVASEGCSISTNAQRAVIQRQTGLDADTQESIRDYLWRAGELDRNSGNYVLKSGQCADA